MGSRSVDWRSQAFNVLVAVACIWGILVPNSIAPVAFYVCILLWLTVRVRFELTATVTRVEEACAYCGVLGAVMSVVGATFLHTL